MRLQFAIILLVPFVLGAGKPMPDKATLDAAKAVARDTYRKELVGADEKSLTAVLKAADAAAGDDAGQAALYLVAATTAAEAGELRISFEALDKLGEQFDFDSLAAKNKVLDSAVKTARTPEAKSVVVNRAFELIDKAVEAGRFDVADAAVKFASPVVAKLKDADLRRELADKRRKVDRLRKEFEGQQRAIAEAEAKLKKEPGDGAANETIGRRLASRNEWRQALQHLSKAADPELRAAAIRDLENPSDAGKQLMVGDAWWVIADSYDGERTVYPARAVYWYSAASPQLTGLANRSKVLWSMPAWLAIFVMAIESERLGHPL